MLRLPVHVSAAKKKPISLMDVKLPPMGRGFGRKPWGPPPPRQFMPNGPFVSLERLDKVRTAAQNLQHKSCVSAVGGLVASCEGIVVIVATVPTSVL